MIAVLPLYNITFDARNYTGVEDNSTLVGSLVAEVYVILGGHMQPGFKVCVVIWLLHLMRNIFRMLEAQT